MDSGAGIVRISGMNGGLCGLKSRLLAPFILCGETSYKMMVHPRCEARVPVYSSCEQTSGWKLCSCRGSFDCSTYCPKCLVFPLLVA